MFHLLTDPNAWAALVTLTALEIVLGIDNVVFLSVLTAKLPAAMAQRARQVGLSLALVFRILLLFLIAKSTHEIHNEIEPGETAAMPSAAPHAFTLVILQIIAVDLVFSIDS